MENTVWAKARYQYRSDTAENWENANPILLAGEHGVVINSNVPYQREKIGDGETPWNDLGWYHGPQGEKGDKGDKVDQGPQGIQGIKGDSYVLTDTDKQEISNVAINSINNAWQKIVDITTTEEVNGIVATVEEFPELAKCKEFIIRAVFPKSPTGENLSLGASYIYFDNTNTAVFRFTDTKLTSAIVEQRCHTFIVDGLIYSTGTSQSISVPSVVGQVNTIVGDRIKRSPVNTIMYRLNTADSLLPTGTQLVIYGKKIEIGSSVEEILGDIETLLGGI